MKKILALTLISTCISTSALAGDFFVEAGVGGAFGNFDGLNFLNPVGTGTTDSDTSGDYILLEGVDDNDASFTGSLAVGYNITDKFHTKLSFHSFGSHEAKGGARFSSKTYEQVLEADAYGVMLGAGYQVDLTDQIFFEPNAEVGLSIIRSEGTQGANLGGDGRFPKETRTDFAFGAGLNLCYEVSENLTLLTGANYYWLGKADTGKTGDQAPSGMSPGEQLQSDLSVLTAKVGLRYNF